MFQRPNPIDVGHTIEVERPIAWEEEVPAERVAVLPLVDDVERAWEAGWTSYTSRFEDAPEVEVMCGGINTKAATAAAVWRQGNLLHFGFVQTPDELNVAGRDLLVNCVHYIAGFTEDRPIARTPSVFVTGRSISTRGAFLKRLRQESYQLEWLTDDLAPAESAELERLGRAGYAERFAAHLGQVTLDAERRLAIDPDLVALGLDNRELSTLTACAAALRGAPEEAARAGRVLARYAPMGPRGEADADRWEAWLEGHAEWLFFHEGGGYRFYLDQLAERRDVPSAELRGPARRSGSSG